MERKIGRKKRYGGLLLITVALWGLIVWCVLRVDPENVKDFLIPNLYLPMGLLMFGGVFFLLSIILMSASMALRWTIAVMVFLYLRVWGLGSMVNGLLILGLMLCIEFYFKKDSAITLNK